MSCLPPPRGLYSRRLASPSGLEGRSWRYGLCPCCRSCSQREAWVRIYATHPAFHLVTDSRWRWHRRPSVDRDRCSPRSRARSPSLGGAVPSLPFWHLQGSPTALLYIGQIPSVWVGQPPCLTGSLIEST